VKKYGLSICINNFTVVSKDLFFLADFQSRSALEDKKSYFLSIFQPLEARWISQTIFLNVALGLFFLDNFF
jgi:hypothetical protein